MRALILSDIHANIEALQSVIDDANRRSSFDIIWSMGDLVGYGPDPVRCLEILRGYDFLSVAGNHDHAAAGVTSGNDFNYAAKAAILWTREQLSQEEVDFLTALPSTVIRDPFTLVHGSLRDHQNEYILGELSASETFSLMDTRFCLVGHSHYPFVCSENEGDPQFLDFPEDEPVNLGQERLIINPGSVGQPRDHNPRPSYAMYDSQQITIERHRVDYDVSATQAKMKQAGLPEHLIERLDHGT